MSSTTLSFLTLLLLCSTPTIVDSLQLDSPSSSSWHPWRRNLRRSTTARTVPPQGYYTPTDAGGSMLTQIPITYPMGQGEPLNAIVSGNSDERVLQDSEANGGLRNYFLSFGFSGECLGQHSGSNQAANLGDGNGYRNETAVIRWNYGDAQLGACKETIQGGNHFRYWVQNGPAGNSGAVFMAVSYELPLDQSHDIIPNGYNLGRDWLVGNITKNFVQTPNVTNSTTFTGTTTWASYTYETNITYVPNLLQNTNDAINHNITVGATTNSVDGLVAVLEVKITGTPPKSFAWRASPPRFWQLPPLLMVLALSFIAS